MHRYWNIDENKRCAYGKAVYRPALSLGGINDSPLQAEWRVIEDSDEKTTTHVVGAISEGKKRRPCTPEGYGFQLRLEVMELC